jgi:hypothetical protein
MPRAGRRIIRRGCLMPVLVIAAIMFALFVGMGVLAMVAVLNETRGMPGSVWKFKRVRNSPQKP